MISAWGKWAPPAERSVLVSLSFAGGSFGTVVTLPLAGLISDKIGWEAVFYFTGGVALLWSIVWLSIIHSSPKQHPRISQAERVYIIQSIGTDKVENAETPWKDIMTSRCVWAIIAGQFANDWGSYTLLALLPTYMATILKFNLSESGELSALPFVLQFFFSVSGGYVTEWIRCRMMISTIVLRKLNTTLGLIVPAISIVLAGYIGCDFKAAVAFFSLSVAFSALNIPGCISNAIDIAPKYGGVIYGISNTIANTAGFLAPQVAGLMLRDEDSISQWQEVFWVAAVVYSLGAVIYLVLGSAEEQTWASGHSVCKSKDEGDGSEEEFLRVNSERADYR